VSGEKRICGKLSLFPDFIPHDVEPAQDPGEAKCQLMTVELNVGLASDEQSENRNDVFIVGSNFSAEPIFRLRLAPDAVEGLMAVLRYAQSTAATAGTKLTPEQAYDLLTTMTQTLLNKAKHRSAVITEVNEIKDALTEVMGAVGLVEIAVRSR
jgi:hypothetical protein